MSNVRTSRKQFMSGMKELQGVWETKLDRHIKDERSMARNILRPLPHLVAALFTIFLLWHVKPSSSTYKYIHYKYTINIIILYVHN